MKEKIRTVVMNGHEFNYEVSNVGTVRNVRTGRIVKPRIGSNGYLRVAICDASIKYKKDKGIHQLVMNAFSPASDDSLEINHKNGDKSDNRIENLEWTTHRENMQHARKYRLFSVGENAGSSKYKESEIENVCEMLQNGGHTFTEISKITGVSMGVVRSIYTGRSWSHVSCKYDLNGSMKGHKNHSEIHNSLDRAIISGKISYSEMVTTLMCKCGLSNNQAQTLIYQRRKKVKKGITRVQTEIFIDDGVELF